MCVYALNGGDRADGEIVRSVTKVLIFHFVDAFEKNLRDKAKADAEEPEAVDDDEMEQEEMFVDPHESFAFSTREWGGPRRGGRFPEPTRYGDWERKGRCSDF